jgi:ribosomal protein RSM22 (predicted rRNA methylase)
MQLPSYLRYTLETIAGTFSRPELERASLLISERYRRVEKADSMLGITSAAEAVAYGATRLPATYAAASKALEALKCCLPDFTPVSALDVGAGPATALFAALEHWPSITALALIEPNQHLLTLGKKLLQESHPTLQSLWQQAEITSLALAQKQHDLVLAGYVLNEIEQEKGKEAAIATIKKLWQATAGALVVIEPGTPAGYATLMYVRDWLIGEGAYLAAPCTHTAPCPLAAQMPQKWCHFSVRVERSKLHRQLKHDATLPYEDEKFMYIAATRKPPLVPAYRLIGHPRGTRLVEADVCSSVGEVKHLTIAKSHPQHKAFRKAEWGDGVKS